MKAKVYTPFGSFIMEILNPQNSEESMIVSLRYLCEMKSALTLFLSSSGIVPYEVRYLPDEMRFFWLKSHCRYIFRHNIKGNL